MGLFNIMIAIVLIVLVIMTFVAEPTISMNYYKAMLKSGYKLVTMIVDFFKKMFIPKEDIR